METRVTTGTLVALACSAVLVYAAPQRTQQQTRPNTGAPPGATAAGIGADKNQNQQNTTITGCLRQGTAGSFVLTQTPGTSVPDGGVGTAGGRDLRGNRYELLADSKTDLSRMVGRQVQVTGMQTIGPSDTPSTGNDRSATRPGSTTTDESRRPNAVGTDKNLGSERTKDQPAIGGGTGERDRRSGDAGLTRFTVKAIRQTGSSC